MQRTILRLADSPPYSYQEFTHFRDFLGTCSARNLGPNPVGFRIQGDARLSQNPIERCLKRPGSLEHGLNVLTLMGSDGSFQDTLQFRVYGGRDVI